jgi:hypothetical protein
MTASLTLLSFVDLPMLEFSKPSSRPGYEWMSEELFGVILLLALLTIMLAVMGIILWHVPFTFIDKPQAPFMMSVGVFVEASTQLTVECLFALTNRLGYIEQVQTSE